MFLVKELRKRRNKHSLGYLTADVNKPAAVTFVENAKRHGVNNTEGMEWSDVYERDTFRDGSGKHLFVPGIRWCLTSQ